MNATLAPTGELRVAVYAGGPTSMVRKAGAAEPVGIAYELGRELARELGVPVRLVELPGGGQRLTDALKAGEADFTFTNASDARARDVDFTVPLLRLELGYLVPADSRIGSFDEVDRPGVKIGVSQGSTSQTELPRLLKAATVVPAPSTDAAAQQLREHGLDAFATNKSLLFELSAKVPGARVLDGRWGVENLAIAVPKGREAARPWLQGFAEKMRSSGELQKMIERAGVRGAARD
ncbi:MAG TPA: transporter substrate-binding domain-containing protein [Ramlibacter sp.]|jgi:polar amino acid transport system substrate-binding protein|nr:transporter substrate-binding domain-containing protein [Ramlibacter sp.]